MTRKEAIRVLEPFKACMFDQHGCPISDAAIALDVAIEALKEQRWIPCSERLPENEVLCCDIHQNLMFGYVFASEKSNTGYSAESEREYLFDCVAWMPLPSPYTEEEQ